MKKMLSVKFNLDAPAQIERAHRDGKPGGSYPRHMLVKFLSFQTKLEVLRGQRAALQEDNAMFIVDDLTKRDLEEKRKYKDQVRIAYEHGMRYHFSAGKWRGKGGVL